MILPIVLTMVRTSSNTFEILAKIKGEDVSFNHIATIFENDVFNLTLTLSDLPNDNFKLDDMQII